MLGDKIIMKPGPGLAHLGYTSTTDPYKYEVEDARFKPSKKYGSLL